MAISSETRRPEGHFEDMKAEPHWIRSSESKNPPPSESSDPPPPRFWCLAIPLAVVLSTLFIWGVFEYSYYHLPIMQYKRHLCEAATGCFESADVPTQRTSRSSRTPEQLNLWFKFHEQLSTEAMEEHCPSRQQKGKNVIFFGDSIFESLRGTSYGVPDKRWKSHPAVLKKIFGEHAKVSAISGDMTQHLLWRLGSPNEGRAGELPANIASGNAVVIILIGTNNLSAGYRNDEIINGILKVVEVVKERMHGSGHIILSGILPRQNDRVNEINSVLADHFRQNDNGVQYFDFGQTFVSGEKGMINADLMPDLLHPNAKGMEAWLSSLCRVMNDVDCHPGGA